MFHIGAYFAANAAGALLADTPYVTDGVISTRNGHPIFTEDYELCAAAVNGVSLTAAQFSDATWNAINTPQLYPPMLSLTVPGNPQINDFRNWPVQIPKNEEIALQLSNNLGAATEREFGLIWVAPFGKPRMLPAPAPGVGSVGRVRAIFTCTGAITQGVWSSDMVVTITNLIKGGTYAMVGCNLVCALGLAFRWNFVRAPLYQGRKLYPGSLCEAAYGNVPLKEGRNFMGVLGYFDTFELPYISILAATTAGSATYTGYLDLIYMGQNMISNAVQSAQADF
jgi:hypothetical protein